MEYSFKDHIVKLKAMICSQQCYILKQFNDDPYALTLRLSYKNMKSVQLGKIDKNAPQGAISIGNIVKLQIY